MAYPVEYVFEAKQKTYNNVLQYDNENKLIKNIDKTYIM